MESENDPEIQVKPHRSKGVFRALWKVTVLVLLITAGVVWYQRRGPVVAPPSKSAVARANRIAFSPERGTKYLAAAFSNGQVRLWETATKREITVKFPSEWPLNDLAWAADGQTLFAGGFEQHILAFNVKSSRAGKLPKFAAPVISVDARPNKPEMLVSLSNGELWWLNLQTEERLAVVSGHVGVIKMVRYRPDGQSFVTGGVDQQLIWHDAVTRVVSKAVAAHDHEISGIAFSPDGSRIASASWDNTVKVWQADGAEPVATLTHPDGVAAVDWRGMDVASSCWDGRLRIWKVATAEIIHNRVCHSDSLAFAVWPGRDVVAEVDSAGTLQLNAP